MTDFTVKAQIYTIQLYFVIYIYLINILCPQKTHGVIPTEKHL